MAGFHPGLRIILKINIHDFNSPVSRGIFFRKYFTKGLSCAILNSVIRIIIIIKNESEVIMEVKRKTSKKRAAILEALASVTEHPTAEMLYNALKPSIPELSLGTVYRNLAVLADEGLVVSVAHVGGQERYDARVEPHAHFVCRKCNNIIDVDIPDMVQPIYEKLSNSTGHTAEGYSLCFNGLCSDCNQKAN